MSPSAIIGIQSCGCITYVNAEPDYMDKSDERAIAKIVRGGGRIERMTVEAVRTLPNFLPAECPHDPKGWEREKPKEPNPIRYKRVESRHVSVVYAKVSDWKHTGGFRGGEVALRDGSWWATEGWMDSLNATATGGSEPREPVEVFGPFSKQREAAEFLLPIATRRAEEFVREMDRAREARRRVATG